MNDITKYFIESKELGLFTEFQLNEISKEILALFPNCICNWDDKAGEEWIRFTSAGEIICMLHTKLKIAFSTFESPKINILFVQVKSFNNDEWEINLNLIQRICCELNWSASEQAVNPYRFSLNDLYYATV